MRKISYILKKEQNKKNDISWVLMPKRRWKKIKDEKI